ncbi:hypothetical protein SFRURICE_019692, partial [Spodoptera frugiperda]
MSHTKKSSGALSQHQSDSLNVTLRTSKNKIEKMDSSANTITMDSIPQKVLREIIRDEIRSSIKSTIAELVTDHLRNINEKLDGFEKSLDFYNKQYEEIK